MHRTRWSRFNRFYRAETEYAKTMPTNNQRMVFLLMLSIYVATSAYAQVESVHLQELVEFSDQRLVIAEQVALLNGTRGCQSRTRLVRTTSLAVLRKRESREAWIQHRCETSSERRSRPTSSSSTHCWQIGAGKGERRITRRSI